MVVMAAVAVCVRIGIRVIVICVIRRIVTDRGNRADNHNRIRHHRVRIHAGKCQVAVRHAEPCPAIAGREVGSAGSVSDADFTPRTMTGSGWPKKTAVSQLRTLGQRVQNQ